MRLKYISVIVAALLLALAVYAILNWTAAQQAPPKQSSNRYGQTFCLNGMPQNYTALDFAMSNDIRCFRTDIGFSAGETGFVSNATASGAQYLGILDYETVGAQPSPNGCISGCNWTLATWNESVANAIADYPEVNEWEIYNEPLASLFVSGYDNGSALNYFNMIRSASLIIKSRNPNATIVCFGGAELYPLQSVEYEYAFYSQVWKYGASRYCDEVSLHVYSLPYYSLNQTIGTNTAGGNVTLGQFYNFSINLYENMTGKPVWITETGITSNNWTSGLNLSEQKQASFLSQDMAFFAKYPFVKRIYWFDYQDSPSGGQEYGLLNGTGQPKLSWYRFMYFVRNSTS